MKSSLQTVLLTAVSLGLLHSNALAGEMPPRIHTSDLSQVSTGGFSKEAKYEAERSNIPLTLIELDDLATLVEQHYENFDANGRALIPLTKIYWPSE
jgi:hypothetical protein